MEPTCERSPLEGKLGLEKAFSNEREEVSGDSRWIKAFVPGAHVEKGKEKGSRDLPFAYRP